MQPLTLASCFTLMKLSCEIWRSKCPQMVYAARSQWDFALLHVDLDRAGWNERRTPIVGRATRFISSKTHGERNSRFRWERRVG